MSFLCRIGLHSFQDKIQLDIETPRRGIEIPVIFKEECKRCKKVRNWVRVFIENGIERLEL